MNVRPSPEVPVPVSAIVTLHPKAQRLPAKHPINQRNPPRENRIRMRCPRKPNQRLTAQFHPKRRSIPQIPRNALPASINPPLARVFPNPILPNLQEKRTSPTPAQSGAFRASLAQTLFAHARIPRSRVLGSKALNRKSLNPSLRLPLPRKPSRPNLHRLALCIPRAPASSRIHQQISKPPSPAPISHPHPQKPNLIPPPHRQLREHLIQRLHASRRITPRRLARTYSKKPSTFSKGE